MENNYINLTKENIESEHICCAISDKKHQDGVKLKKQWLGDRMEEGHVFRKLDAKGKVFIEYAPLDLAWVPVVGENFLYIYCLWVSGSFKGKGHANDLLNYCIDEAKLQNKSGICVLSSKKKEPFLSDKKFFIKHGFKVVDQIGDFELLALCFDENKPTFSDTARKQMIESNNLTIYYTNQCPYISNCIVQIKNYCYENNIKVDFIEVDSLEKAKKLPGIFNNWAIYLDNEFKTVHILNEGYLKKLLSI